MHRWLALSLPLVVPLHQGISVYLYNVKGKINHLRTDNYMCIPHTCKYFISLGVVYCRDYFSKICVSFFFFFAKLSVPNETETIALFYCMQITGLPQL